MIRFGLIGAGRIAHGYVQAFARTRNAQLVAIADVERAAAAKLAAEAGCADVAPDAIAQLVDAVIVSAPPSSHAPLALGAIAAGAHVLCEKPFSITTDDAATVAAAAKAAGTVVTMASKFRYVSDLRAARQMVESGAIGDLELIEVSFVAPVAMADRWNSNPAVAGGGVLIDNGTHAIDIVRAFGGSVASIKAVRGRQMQGLAVEDAAHAFVRCTSGALASIDLSWNEPPASDAYLRLRGARGTIEVGWKRSYLRRDGEDRIWFGNGYDRTAAFCAQLENFAGAVESGERLAVTIDDACASVAAIEAAYAAMDDGRWHDVTLQPAASRVGAA